MDDLPMMPSTSWAIDSGEWPRIVQAYLACVSFVDFYIGEILQALQQSRHAHNTIVVLWSDHGYRLGEKHTFAKHCLWEEATNAPLIFAGPGIERGEIISAPAEMLSIYPTLLELCDLPPYERNEGVSLVPILRGTAKSVQSFALTTYGWGNHALRSEHLRYIRYQDGSEEFYDHRTDPNEWHNLGNEREKDIKELERYLPAENAPYAKHSQYKYNPFFTRDKLNHSQ
jgi:arylsulfatase A-like enzyme